MRARLVFLALAAACSSPPAVRPALDLASFTSFDTAAFPGGTKVLAGFAQPDEDPAIRVGDAALLGVELHRAGVVERQLLLLEAHAVPPELIDGVQRPRVVRAFEIVWTAADGTTKERTHPIRGIDVQLTRLRSDGELLQRSVALLWEEPLATGWWPYSYSNPPQREDDLAFALSMTVQELANSDPNLKDLLFRVVDAPSLWSIATNFGVNVNLAWSVPPDPERVDVPWFAGEVRRAQMALRINGDTSSWVDMLVAQPKDATRVCGGLVGVIARHPTESGRMAVVRLLATRRGAPAPR